MLPLVIKQSFAPAPVTEDCKRFPREMSLRPSALRAAASETGSMIGAARELSERYDVIRVRLLDAIAANAAHSAILSDAPARAARRSCIEVGSNAKYLQSSMAGQMSSNTPWRLIAHLPIHIGEYLLSG
jgi:hypothetical protein